VTPYESNPVTTCGANPGAARWKAASMSSMVGIVIPSTACKTGTYGKTGDRKITYEPWGKNGKGSGSSMLSGLLRM
jgi:hypothetical protein